MSITNFSHICRACLSQNIPVKSVFIVEAIMDQQITLCDMIMNCASVTIIREDGLPENLCTNCIEEVHRAFLFKNMCERSDATLRNWLNALAPDILHPNCETNDGQLEKRADLIIDTNNMSCDEEHTTLDETCDDCDSIKSNRDVTPNSKNVAQVEGNRKKSKSYKCEECSEECLGLASYWKHMANVHGKNFSCEICQINFKSYSLLTQHKISKHQDQPKPTKNKTGVIKKRNLPRTCNVCNKTFRFHSNLERHKLIHTGEKPFLCNVCGKGFGQMSYLKIHSFIHTGEKPYKCQMCDKSFAAPGTLMTHIRIHTGERPHVCKICGKDFPQSGYLSAHIRTHTGEKPVECKVCHRRFNQSGRLVIHMRIHSGEKPYPCKECGRSFAVKGTLKKHIRIHTGERPYICSVCGQAFAQSGTLTTHMKIHRPKQ